MNRIKLKLLAGSILVLHLMGCHAQNKKLMGHGEKVLVIGRHADMLQKITEMLNRQGYNTIGKQWNEEAIAAFQAEVFDAVLIGGGVDNESRQLFHDKFPITNPNIKIIDAHPQTVLSDLNSALQK